MRLIWTLKERRPTAMEIKIASENSTLKEIKLHSHTEIPQALLAKKNQSKKMC